MADVGVCNASGCFGKCPTSTICGLRSPCPPESPCPPGEFVQREGCGSGCRCPAPEKCPRAYKNKDYLNVIAEDYHYFQHFYKLVRTSPRMPNKRSQLPKGPDGKPIMKGGKRGSKGKSGEAGSESDKSGGLFDSYNDDNYDMGDDGYGDGGGSRRRRAPPSKEARLRNKLNTLFDEALRTGLLGDLGGKKGKKKRTPEYYKEKLGIGVSCVKDCQPLCCDEDESKK